MAKTHSRFRAIPANRAGTLLVFAGLAGLLGLVACTSDTDPPSVPRSAATAPVSADDGDLSRGRELFSQSCASCHGQQGGGTQRGPSLEDAGAASADFYLSTGRMPLPDPHAEVERGEPVLNDEDIDALVDYVATLGDGPPIPTVEPGNAAQGHRAYLGSCASCHSASTTGGALPHGESAPSLVPADARQIAEAVRIGPGTMPPFSEHAISDEEMNDIVSYIVSLREPQDHGGNALGSYGPATEGLIGWIVGLGLLLVVARLLGKKTT